MNLYLCVMENTENNNIHNNQIFPLIKNMKTLFISPLFIVSRSKIGLNRNKFPNLSVDEVKIPLFSYNFLMHPFLFPFFLMLSVPILLFYIKKNEINTIHCRNLLSSVLAVTIKKYFYNNINVISDFRGHYPEEGVILNRWKHNSTSFRFWKWLEKKSLIHSTSCTFISNSMKSYYNEIFPRDDYFFAPAIVDTKYFYFCPELRNEIRNKYRITDDEIVYIYTGSYGQWHDLGVFYSMLEAHIKEYSIESYRVFILSGQKSEQYSEYEDMHSTLTIKVAPHEVNKYLCGADVGVLPGTQKTSISYDLLYKTMVSSKVEEYFCTGLQVLSNPRIGEVKALSELTIASVVKFDRSSRGAFYQDIFSSTVVGKLYERLYQID